MTLHHHPTHPSRQELYLTSAEIIWQYIVAQSQTIILDYLRQLPSTILDYLRLSQTTILDYLRLSLVTNLDHVRQLYQTILGNYLRQLSQATISGNYLRVSWETILDNLSFLDYLRQLSQTILSEYIRLFMATILDNLKQLSLTILCNYPRLSETIVKTPTSTQHNPKTTSTDVGFDMNMTVQTTHPPTGTLPWLQRSQCSVN